MTYDNLGRSNTMKIFNYRDVEPLRVKEGSDKMNIRWLITKELGSNSFALRLFEVQSGGFSPIHNHPWEHGIFILEGEGMVVVGKEERNFAQGDVIFIPSNEQHQMRNTGIKTLRFLCLVPYKNSYAKQLKESSL